jgi:hypothetical protein
VQKSGALTNGVEEDKTSEEASWMLDEMVAELAQKGFMSLEILLPMIPKPDTKSEKKPGQIRPERSKTKSLSPLSVTNSLF